MHHVHKKRLRPLQIYEDVMPRLMDSSLLRIRRYRAGWHFAVPYLVVRKACGDGEGTTLVKSGPTKFFGSTKANEPSRMDQQGLASTARCCPRSSRIISGSSARVRISYRIPLQPEGKNMGMGSPAVLSSVLTENANKKTAFLFSECTVWRHSTKRNRHNRSTKSTQIYRFTKPNRQIVPRKRQDIYHVYRLTKRNKHSVPRNKTNIRTVPRNKTDVPFDETTQTHTPFYETKQTIPFHEAKNDIPFHETKNIAYLVGKAKEPASN